MPLRFGRATPPAAPAGASLTRCVRCLVDLSVLSAARAGAPSASWSMLALPGACSALRSSLRSCKCSSHVSGASGTKTCIALPVKVLCHLHENFSRLAQLPALLRAQQPRLTYFSD